MLCQKTSASDEAIVCWYLHSYLDKWIQEFQEEEEYSAANGGQRHPKRNKGKGKHISESTSPGCPNSITYCQRRRYRQKEAVLKFQMIGIRVSSLKPIGSTMRKRKG